MVFLLSFESTSWLWHRYYSSALLLPGRYLVATVVVKTDPNNVYATVDAKKKPQFYATLDTANFEDHATHYLFGDLTTSLDPYHYSSSPHVRYDCESLSCLEWLSKLRVVYAWRVHYGFKRIFTGPLPCKNRLEYILMYDAFCTRFYGDYKYFLLQHADG